MTERKVELIDSILQVLLINILLFVLLLFFAASVKAQTPAQKAIHEVNNLNITLAEQNVISPVLAGEFYGLLKVINDANKEVIAFDKEMKSKAGSYEREPFIRFKNYNDAVCKMKQTTAKLKVRISEAVRSPERETYLKSVDKLAEQIDEVGLFGERVECGK